MLFRSWLLVNAYELDPVDAQGRAFTVLHEDLHVTQRRARREQSLSLLDSVLDEAASLQRTLPAADRARLDRYLSDVREIERRVQKMEAQDLSGLDLPDVSVGTTFDQRLNLMFDMVALAYQANLTRVFEVGHAYVALTRTALSRVRIVGPKNFHEHILANPRAVRFYNVLEEAWSKNSRRGVIRALPLAKVLESMKRR